MAATKFTYSGDPSKTPRDAVRFLIGDTIKAFPMFGDREIDFQISRTPNERMAGAELLLNKSNQFARLADERAGDVSKSFSKVATQMKAFSENLREQALKRAKPFFGGLTKSGKRALRERDDDVQPQFSIGQNDDPTIVQLNKDFIDLLGRVDINGFF